MISWLKPIQLPEDEEFCFRSNVSKDEVLSRMRDATSNYRHLSLPLLRRSLTPKFSGRINGDDFEVVLIWDPKGSPKKPLFSPPHIKAIVNESKPAEIHAKIGHAKFQRMFLKLFSGGAIVWWCLWALALPLGLLSGAWEASQTTDLTLAAGNADQSDITEFGITGILLIYLGPLFVVPLGFIYWPKTLTTHTMIRSKKVLIEYLDGYIVQTET